ncbi:MAG: TolC family protein [Gemmatimonadaceae bacterium]|nr:TolC family protein [Gemmatimonadaceae bacterium]
MHRTALQLVAVTLTALLPLSHALQAQTATTVTFEDAVRLALKQSVTVRQASNTAANSEATVRQRSQALLPNFTLSTSTTENYGYNFNQNEGRIVDQATTNFQIGANSGVTLYDGGRNRANLREARLTDAANESDLVRARQTAVFTVAAQYLTLVQAQEQLRVQRDNLLAQRAQDSVIQRLVRAGARPISDQYQQQATVASAQFSVVSAERNSEAASVSLIQTLQLDPLGRYRFVPPAMSDSVRVARFDLDSLLTKALGSRADLAALKTRMEASRQSISSASGARLPSLSMNLGYSSAFNSASNLTFNDQLSQRRNGSLGVSISVPIFDRGVASVATQQARIAADNVRLQQEDRAQTVAGEIRRAYLDHAAAVQQFEAAQAQLRASELAASTTLRRYEVGAGTLVEVTTARAQLVQAASAVVTARFTLAFQQSLMSYYVGDLVPEQVALQ